MISLAAAGLLMASATADVPQAIGQQVFRGMASNWPMGVIVTGSTGAGAPAGVLVKKPRDQDGPLGMAPAPLTARTYAGPDAYDALVLLEQKVSSLGGAAIEIDAISSGNAHLPALGGADEPNEGVPQLYNAWMALAVSVDSAAGTAAGTRFFGASEPGSEIVGYYARDSVGIGSALPGVSPLEVGRTQLGFPAGGTEDVGALDIGLGIQQFLPPAQGGISAIFRNRDQLYFSVTPSWAESFNSGPAAGFAEDEGGYPTRAHAGDIYLMLYEEATDTTPAGWKGPFRWASAMMLGFQGDNGDVDGLDVDRSGKFLFSPKKGCQYLCGGDATPMPQLLYAWGNVTVGAPRFASDQGAPLLIQELNDFAPGTTTPVPVTQLIGTDTPPGVDPTEDELDAVTTWDPEQSVLDTQFGTPGAHPASTKTPMGLSLIRSNLASDVWDVQVTGWGDLDPATVRITILVRSGALPSGPLPGSGWLNIHNNVRMASDNAYDFRFRLPASSSSGTETYAVMAFLTTANGKQAFSWASEFHR